MNIGITKTLNYALSITKSKYVIRMDSDYISLRNRFEVQINLIEKNPDIAVLGTSAIVINEKNEK